MARLPTMFLCHGGGPWPWMDGDFRARYAGLEASLKMTLASLPQPPKAMLVISGHWEAPVFAVGSHPTPSMIYDYGGFPEFTYRVRYDSPGDPALAARVQQLLQAGGLDAVADPVRGYDHGVFTLTQVISPEAAIPVFPMSIRRDFDPKAHLAAGRLLAPLRDEGVLIIGSGMTYHDLRNLGPAARAPSEAFDAWLRGALVGREGDDRARALADWDQAPAARQAQPREDHLIPLMVAAGAGEDSPCRVAYHEAAFFGHVAISNFVFG